jgi:hypothetical protein
MITRINNRVFVSVEICKWFRLWDEALKKAWRWLIYIPEKSRLIIEADIWRRTLSRLLFVCKISTLWLITPFSFRHQKELDKGGWIPTNNVVKTPGLELECQSPSWYDMKTYSQSHADKVKYPSKKKLHNPCTVNGGVTPREKMAKLHRLRVHQLR